MEDKERDADLEVPFAGFVPKDKHTGVNPDSTKGSGEEEEGAFGGAVNVSALHRFTFILEHEEERGEVYEGEKG